MLRPYLEGTRSTIRTDHDSLKRTLTHVDAAGRWALWRPRLSKFEFDVFHPTVIKHQADDAQSRLQTTNADADLTEDDLPVAVIEADTIGSTKMRLEKHEQAIAEVDVDDHSSNEGEAPTITSFLLHQAINLYCRQAEQGISSTNARYKFDQSVLCDIHR